MTHWYRRLYARIQKEYLVKTGLCYETDDGRLARPLLGRVMFPQDTLSGKSALEGVYPVQRTKSSPSMSTLPESLKSIIKSNELYGIYFAKQAIVNKTVVFLVEGYTDVISMHQSGVENVVAAVKCCCFIRNH